MGNCTAWPTEGSGGGLVNGHGPGVARRAPGGGSFGGGSGSAMLSMAGNSRFCSGIIVGAVMLFRARLLTC